MDWSDALEVLYEDNHLVAVNKPCGWPSAHFDGQNETVDRLVKSYLKEKYDKPGNVFLGVVHRLDRPVGGVLVFARTSKAAARLSEQFRLGAVEKTYWAVTEAVPPDMAGTLTDHLAHDDEAMRSQITTAEDPNGKLSALHYEKRAEHGGWAWLEIRPQTGRKHQIRVQLASRGWIIYADHKYGSVNRFGHAIGLHARTMTLLHPISKEPLTLTAPVPNFWRGRFAYLFGAKDV